MFENSTSSVASAANCCGKTLKNCAIHNTSGQSGELGARSSEVHQSGTPKSPRCPHGDVVNPTHYRRIHITYTLIRAACGSGGILAGGMGQV